MDENKIVTQNHIFECEECGNEITVSNDLKKGDVFECEHCGIEYRIVEINDENEFVIEIVEEEK